uniref:Uncharacterized protein n=1 Tax=Panagrolaimus superbus TaxID=310955 RepID=A0A914YJ96_9BILA
MLFNKFIPYSVFFYRNFRQCSAATKSVIQNGIYLDTRKIGERKVINPKWTLKNGNGSLRIEKIDEKDFDLIAKFYNYQFVQSGNIWKAIDAKYEDTEGLILNALSIPIKQPLSYAAFDKNELVGICLNRLHKKDEISKLFGGKLYDSNAKLCIKKDYAEDISNGPYNHNGNRIHVLLNECLTQTGKFLPKDIQNLGYIKVTVIKEEYMRNGLFQYLFIESIKSFKENDCKYFIVFCSATASAKMCKKMGMWSAFCFPYSKFKENGIPVFQNLDDGADGVHLMMGKVDVAMKILEESRKK